MPRTLIERDVANIWADSLCLERVGIRDTFFELGGHYLAATRIISQVLKTFQIELPLQSLFAAPTVAEMAAVIAEHRGKTLATTDLAQVLAELESLSNAEAQQQLLAAQSTTAKLNQSHH